MPKAPLGERQLQVMEVIWEQGECTVAEVHEALGGSANLAYTTVLTVLRALDRRGFVGHRRVGKAHRFFPNVSREDYTQGSVQQLVERLFRGSPAQLMSHLLGSKDISDSERHRIRQLLSEEEGA